MNSEVYLDKYKKCDISMYGRFQAYTDLLLDNPL